jgi:hypothetical protein
VPIYASIFQETMVGRIVNGCKVVELGVPSVSEVSQAAFANLSVSFFGFHKELVAVSSYKVKCSRVLKEKLANRLMG